MANQDNETPATGEPLLIEGPKSETDSPIIDLEPLKATEEDMAAHAAEQADEPSSGRHLPRYAPLAAAIAFAVVLGGLAGAAGMAALVRDASPPPSIAAMDATRDLQKTVAHLNNEVATLKASIATAQRSASTQLGKLADRLDHAEKAQAEPVAKLAKIQESLDRLDKRQQQAAAAPAPAPASDITGSVTPKDAKDAKPQVVDGWRLRDYYQGRAVVESSNGTLFEVGPGSNLPGLGKVESIKRENGKVVVLTHSGMIVASLEVRRVPYYPPYRY